MTKTIDRDEGGSKGFEAWFQEATAHGPRDWQVQLGGDRDLRSRVIRIPTGYGKTLGVLGAWLYHRVERGDASWPRRLVWTLPMRVLAEQTEAVVKDCLARIGCLCTPGADHAGKVGVHLLIGGADPGGEWNLHPEECAVFIGTQDMLLSRALNRGYAAARARWPMEFGLLNHDALWILDEVQLMDVGLATSAQLQAYFDQDSPRGFKPRVSWWMSATLQPEWLRSVDTDERHGTWVDAPISLPASARSSGPAAIRKTIATDAIAPSEHASFARRCADAHTALADGEFGRITLVVCNTVERACKTYDALEKLKTGASLELVHSRFRPLERASWKARFLERSTCLPGANRIIVATQVVEAGVDISAGALVTELAPWSSLVQRFGRCARYGSSGQVLVIDRGRDEKTAPPYEPEQLDGAAGALAQLIEVGDVGIASLEAYEESLTPEQRAALYPYRPEHLLIRRELDELFDTTPDLTGADIDISRFIRSGDERDVSVFWLEVPKGKKGELRPEPPKRHRPSRDELCSVPFLRAQEWLCGAETKTNRKPRLRPGVRAWTWDWIEGEWVVVERSALIPGKVVCVAADVGGYRPERGFDPDSTAAVVPVPGLVPAAQDEADDAEDSEQLSASSYKTIATHDREVGEEVTKIASDLELPGRLAELVVLAGRWHDLGKAHPAFQGAIRAAEPRRNDLAKAPAADWQRPMTYPAAPGDHRRGFRHELASCLALFGVLRRYAPDHPGLLGPWAEVLRLTGEGEIPARVAEPSIATSLERAVLDCTAEEFDLVAYLVLAHHGKVRVSLHAGPKDQEYVDRDGRGLPIRGVREEDLLPGIELAAGEQLPDLHLSLSPAGLGLSSTTGRSWRDRTQGLTKRYGPAGLAWLEALLIAADRRASKLTTTDPLLGSSDGGPR
jgi:CRISPR-associated endonuclease/helicase Cas3